MTQCRLQLEDPAQVYENVLYSILLLLIILQLAFNSGIWTLLFLVSHSYMPLFGEKD